MPEGRRGKGLLIVAAIAVVVGFYYVVGQVLPHENLQNLLNDLSNSLGAWTYLIVGGFAFMETGAFVGLFVPGETVMLLGGAVAGQGAIDIYLLIAIAWFCAWAGDTASFFIGRRLGRDFVLRHGPRVGISEDRFEKVEAYFGRHGGKTILVGRFISLVRALAPFIAGSSGMRYRAFVPYSILGCGIWASAHILIGYFFSRSIDTAATYAGKGAFLLATLIVVVVVVVLAVRFFRVPENRRQLAERMQTRATTRWILELGRRMRPQARFIWARLTPGGTFGLEFTSLLAVLAVGLFVLIAYTEIVTSDPGPTPGDVTAQNVVDSIRTGWLTAVAKVITVFGSPVVTWTLAFGCAVALAARRRWLEFWVLLSGMVIAIVGVHAIKDAVDRPRPDGALVDASGSAFPSAHATYSVLYVWLTVTIVRRLRPGMARGSLVVAGGIAMAGLVGLSRVYLGVHFLSDVNAGWALGASSFALCAAVALAINQFRQNPPTLRLRTKTES